MPKQLSVKRACELTLLVTTAALTFMADGSLKDLVISVGICLAIFTASHRGWRTTYGRDPTDVAQRSRASSAWSMVFSVIMALGLTLALTLLPSAPKLYLFSAAAPAMYATFNLVTSRIFPKSISVACTLTLILTVFLWPDKLCGVGLLYISFVSQIVETVILDRFAAALCLNLVVFFLEGWTNYVDSGLPLLVATIGGELDGGSGSGLASSIPVGYIWKSLKDVAVVGTLFPVLISFDLRKSKNKSKKHGGVEGYFFVAILTFSLSLIGMTSAHAMELTSDHPLCLSTSLPVLVVVLLRALMQGELGKLLRFSASSSRERLD